MTLTYSSANSLTNLTQFDQYLSHPALNFAYQGDVLIFALSMFIAGLIAMIINARNILIIMVAAELMYLGAIVSFAFFGLFTGNTIPVSTALLLLILAAAETALGLGILVVLHRFGGTVNLAAFTQLKG